MQFKVQQPELLQALQAISGVVEKRQTMPILSHFLLQAKDNTLTITGTDLELEITTHLPVAIIEEGQSTVPARKLFDICRGLGEGEISFVVEDDQLRVKSGRSRFVLSTLKAEDFPKQENMHSDQTFQLAQKDLRKLLERTHFSMARQDVRYYLNGLLFVILKNKIRAVATDGHRLAMCEMSAETAIDNETRAIVPRKGILELRRLLSYQDELVTITVTENQLCVSFATIRFTTKLIDGRFPDYQRVIPGVGNKRLTAKREVIHAALSRTSILSNEKFRGVRFKLGDGKLVLQAQNPEQEEAEEELDVHYEGEPLEIGFNVTYLLEALSAMDTEEFTLEMSNADSSGLLKEHGDESSQYVVMPMRL